MQRTGLDNIGWSLTNRCNMNCKHCYNNSKENLTNELTWKQKMAVVEQLKSDKNIKAVNFGGGECIIHPEFKAVVQELSRADILVNLNTNGFETEKLEKVAPYLNKISISLDFAVSEFQDEFREKENCIDKIKSTLEMLKGYEVQKELTTCITNQTYKNNNVENILELSLQEEIDIWRLRPLRNIGRATINKKWSLDAKELLDFHYYLINCLNNEANNRALSISGEEIFEESKRYYGGGCDCGTHVLRIHADGRVSPCVYIQNENAPNILDYDISTIWNSKIFREIRGRILPEECRMCSSLKSCGGGCPGAVYNKRGHFNEKDELCYKNIDESLKNIYLSSLYVPIWKLLKKSYNSKFIGNAGVWERTGENTIEK